MYNNRNTNQHLFHSFNLLPHGYNFEAKPNGQSKKYICIGNLHPFRTSRGGWRDCQRVLAAG